MATDLDEDEDLQQGTTSQSPDPAQQHYDEEFDALTSPEHYDQDAEDPNDLRDAEENPNDEADEDEEPEYDDRYARPKKRADEQPVYGPLTRDQQKAQDRKEADERREQARMAKREERFKSRVTSGSGFKKRWAIAGTAAGGSVIVGIIAFIALLPLKIEHIISNLDAHFGAATAQALDHETEQLYSNYVARQVLPNFNKKACRSTVDATCVSLSKDTGPVGRLYNSWTQSRLESKLATKYNIVIGKKGTQLYMNMDGFFINDSQMRSVQAGTHSLFDLPGTRPATRSEIRAAVRDSMKGATLYDRVYTRFKFGKFIEAKYGVKRCIIACNTRDKFADGYDTKKNAAKALLIRRVVTPLSDSYGLIFQCLIAGTCDTTSGSDNSEADDPEKTSKFQRDLQAQLDQFAAQYGSDALKKLVDDSNSIGKDGFSKYFLSRVLSKAFGKEITTETINHLANPLSLIQDGARIVGFVNDTGKLTALGYAAITSGAVATAMTFTTVVSEYHSGHIDATELGSFTDQLSSNGVDATATPLYNQIIGERGSTTTASFFSPVSAATTSVKPGQYPCDNGNPVPRGKAVCSEEDLRNGNPASDIVKKAQALPGWGILSDSSSVVSAIGSSSWNPLNWLSRLGTFVVTYTPGVKNLAEFLGGFAAKLMGPLFDLIKVLINSPIHDPDHSNGGRNVDIIAMGKDAALNKANETQLGAGTVSPAAMNAIQNQALAEQKAELQHQSFFARMFDTQSSYSLVSRLADYLPTNLVTGADNLVASLLSNPFGKLSGAFAGLFSPSRAFAATPLNTPDPFGVTQYAWTQDQLDQVDSAVQAAGGYDQYWELNCSGHHKPYIYVDENGNFTPWIDGQALDSVTGDSIPSGPNPCMLVQAAVQSSGGTSDSSLLPKDSQNSDGDQGDTTPSTAGGGTVDTSHLFDDSTGTACAAGTKDLGTQTGYHDGHAVPIRICAVSNLPSTGQESNGGYGISGADGNAVVNSRVSGTVYAMAAAANKDGVKLSAISSFRTMSHQEALCPCDGVHVAKPGFSNHQMGLAIDFGGGLPSTPGPIAGNQFWDWLSNNAGGFGYKNYPAEAWHWSPTGN